jgi:hypothetical protein
MDPPRMQLASSWVGAAGVTVQMNSGPERWLPGRIRGATVRLQGRNLFRITDFQGLDPEASDDGANALYRQGYYRLPAYRTFLLSFKVDF